MNEKQVDWNDLQLFLAVAREGGLSNAARVAGKSPATLGRRMYALEKALGCELFARHDRGYELLAEGKALLDELQGVEGKLHQLTMPSQKRQLPLIKLSAGTWTTLYLLDHIDELSGSPPDCCIRFIASEKVLDISHREVVIGFRNQRPLEENLVCRKLMRIEFAAFSTESAPERWIKTLADTPSSRWLAKTAGDNVLVEVSAPRNSLDLALSGKGIALLPTFIGNRYPQLVQKGDVIDELSHDQWLVIHHKDRYLPEVRRLIERIGRVYG